MLTIQEEYYHVQEKLAIGYEINVNQNVGVTVRIYVTDLEDGEFVIAQCEVLILDVSVLEDIVRAFKNIIDAYNWRLLPQNKEL